MAEGGFAGVELDIWQGIVAPLGTPPAIVQKLNAELTKAAKAPDVVEKVPAQAVELTTSSPADFGNLSAADVARLGKLIREAGIRAQ
jgi:tripartite-type tricarboxylate transporter receptor subunit TctC